MTTPVKYDVVEEHFIAKWDYYEHLPSFISDAAYKDINSTVHSKPWIELIVHLFLEFTDYFMFSYAVYKPRWPLPLPP